MPNPKLGTVTVNVKDAVAAAKRGQAEFRVEKRGIIMASVGKVSFGPSELKDNLRSFLLAVSDQKPEGLKGTFMRSAYIRCTMGPAIPLDMAYLDPSSPRFMEFTVTPPAAGTGAAPLVMPVSTAASPLLSAAPLA
jgi:large subunit ribosomal protein L1